jgi:peptidyl-prolyl cis-trans isomerase C
MRRLLRHPALHFLAIGALLFVGQRAAAPARPTREVLEISSPQVAALRQRLETRSGATVSLPELAAEIDGAVEEEIWFREALALGLERSDPVARQRLILDLRFALGQRDADEAAVLREAYALGLDRSDPVVRRRLVQRMQLAAGAAARAAPVSEEALRRYYAAHSERFLVAARLRITQVYLPAERRAEAAALGATLANVPPERAPALGTPFLLGHHLPLQSPEELERSFGGGFGAAVEGLAPGRWWGPIPSSYGVHFVWVQERSPARLRPLDEVRPQVLAKVRAERERAARATALAELSRRYDVIVAGEAWHP